MGKNLLSVCSQATCILILWNSMTMLSTCPPPGVGRSAMKQLAEHLYVMNQAIARTLQKSWSSPPFGKSFGDIWHRSRSYR